MLLYSVIILPIAEKQLEKLSEDVKQRVLKKIKSLSKEPEPNGYIKVTGTSLYRVKVGKWRIAYTFLERTTLYILRIESRGHLGNKEYIKIDKWFKQRLACLADMRKKDMRIYEIP